MTMPSGMQPELRTIRLSEIIFDETIYARPRGHDPALAQQYADDWDKIEAAKRYMAVASDMKLLDGKHRWLAARMLFDGDREIQVLLYPVSTPYEQVKLAIKLNADHGRQLSNSDKQADAKTLHSYGDSYDEIAETLSVSKRKVTAWLHDVARDEKEKRDRRIFEMWMACDTMEEIAKATDCTKDTVSKVVQVCQKRFHETKSDKSIANFDDWDAEEGLVPVYNVWRQTANTNEVSHFGNSEPRWTERLVYMYTEPFDVVIDPFVGGGATVDVCRKRFRRYWVSDRKPILAREGQIRHWDMVNGVPPIPRWQDVRLIFLDPPYWRQAKNQYSKDPEDLANMELPKFTSTLAGIINAFAKKLQSGAVIALMMSPTQWNAENRKFTDHLLDMARLVRLPIDMRIQAPYECSQCQPQQVMWAKENRTCLVLSREIVVWRVE
jgi:hypothetical protein